MSTIFDQKFIVGILGLCAIMALVFTGKANASDAVDYIKWFAGAYILATGAVAASQKIAISNVAKANLTPESHARLMNALQAKE